MSSSEEECSSSADSSDSSDDSSSAGSPCSSDASSGSDDSSDSSDSDADSPYYSNASDSSSESSSSEEESDDDNVADENDDSATARLARLQKFLIDESAPVKKKNDKKKDDKKKKTEAAIPEKEVTKEAGEDEAELYKLDLENIITISKDLLHKKKKKVDRPTLLRKLSLLSLAALEQHENTTERMSFLSYSVNQRLTSYGQSTQKIQLSEFSDLCLSLEELVDFGLIANGLQTRIDYRSLLSEQDAEAAMRSFWTSLRHLYDEFWKTVQTINTQGSTENSEYFGQLGKYQVFLRILPKYLTLIGDEFPSVEAKARLLRMELSYFMTSEQYARIIEALQISAKLRVTLTFDDVLNGRTWTRKPIAHEDLAAKVDQIFDNLPPLADSILEDLAFVRAHGTGIEVTLANLLFAYHLGVSGDYFKAREVFLCTPSTEAVSDVGLQVMHNRCLGRLGLTAFENCLTYECHQHLAEMCQFFKVKEYLAQGIAYHYRAQTEKTQEQDQEEKRRQIPPHLHLPIDYLDCAHQISAMLLEAPNIVLSTHRETYFPYGSKAFRKNFDQFVKQNSMGSVEVSREALLVATKALIKGNWLECYEQVVSLRFWAQVNNAEAVQLKLRKSIQLCGLKCFLLAFNHYYQSISLKMLETEFELESEVIIEEVNKLILHDYLDMVWSPDLTHLQITKIQPTEKEIDCVKTINRTSGLIDHYEMIFESRQSWRHAYGRFKPDMRLKAQRKAR